MSPQNRLNLHDLAVKKKGGGEIGPIPGSAPAMLSLANSSY